MPDSRILAGKYKKDCWVENTKREQTHREKQELYGGSRCVMKEIPEERRGKGGGRGKGGEGGVGGEALRPGGDRQTEREKKREIASKHLFIDMLLWTLKASYF